MLRGGIAIMGLGFNRRKKTRLWAHLAGRSKLETLA
jgi:hypothetical protein